MPKLNICKQCGKRVRRIRQRHTAYIWFCSLDCSSKYRKNLIRLIKEKEKEIKSLKEELNFVKELRKWKVIVVEMVENYVLNVKLKKKEKRNNGWKNASKVD